MSKTIYWSGKAVSTNWLNSSQYLGPSNPGVAFVANPIGDWEYPLLKGASLDLTDFANYFVARSGNQQIAGVKSFTSIPEFPTSVLATGNQGVNVSRLSTDLSTLSVGLSAQIASNNATNVAAIAALSTDLNTNFVTLATTQAITGTKNFTNISVPATPSIGTSPISLTYFDTKAVQVTGNQAIAGTKTFADIKVPNPSSSGDAVNLAYLLGALAPNSLTLSGNTIQFANGLKIVFGFQTGGGGGQAQAFSFPVTFSYTPTVVATPYESAQTVMFAVSSVTTTGYSAWGRLLAGGNISLDHYFIAIGY
jgi:hypothetical protein